MIVPDLSCLVPFFAPPGGFEKLPGETQDRRCFFVGMWYLNIEKSPGATQDKLEIAGATQDA